MNFNIYKHYITLPKYNGETPWGRYKCIETCRSDCNINIVKKKNK